MKILIVNYYYPPLVDAHAYRWEQIARHWAASGHEVEVITGPVTSAPHRARENGVDVTRTGIVARPIAGSSSTARTASFIGRIKGCIAGMIRPAYRKLYWPDSAWHWIPSLLAEIFHRRKTRYDTVVSYYPCMGALLAVRALRWLSRHPNFYWIVDYGDPFSTSPTMQPNNYKLYGGLNKCAERAVARAADAIVFTNRPSAEACKAALGYGDKMHVVPHLVNIMGFYSGNAWQPKNADAPFVLDYIGGFHKGIREPGRLFDLIRQLNKNGTRKYLLRLYGPLNNFSKAELSPQDCPEISYLGPMERPKAVETLKRADAIVNVDNENCIMTPSKIVECIATGRPLVNITNQQTVYPPFQAYEGKGFAVSVSEPEVTEAVAQKLRTFLDDSVKTGTAPADIVKEVLAPHALETIAAVYLDFCRRRG